MKQEWRQPVKIILVVLGVMLAVMLVWWGIVQVGRNSERSVVEKITTDLEQDRQAADGLVERLQQLQELRGELTVPQVELNIRL
jgi:Tfp pilus assembly protein PilO